MENRENGDVASLMQRILYEVKKVVVGQDHFLERVLVAILAQGHLLVEGVPGLAKTLTVKTLAKVIRASCRRTWSARGSTTRRPATSRRRSGRCSPTCCSPTRSIAPRPRCRARCSR